MRYEIPGAAYAPGVSYQEGKKLYELSFAQLFLVLPADELVVFDVHRERAARGDIAGEDGSRQQRFHAALEIPAQRTRAVSQARCFR